MINDLEIFSSERLLRYKLHASDSEEIVLKRYLWNIQLSEACYPALSLVEVALRNRVDKAISAYFDESWLHENWEHWPKKNRYETTRINEAKAKLKGNYSRGHLIAELNLGFWIALFRKQYKPLIWNRPKLFEQVFPAFDKKVMNRVTVVFKHLERIRIVRNRISHHEPVFDIPGGLDQAYNDLEQVIFWLSPDALRLLRSISRFRDVWNLMP